MELSRTKMENGPKDEKKAGSFGKWLLKGTLISVAVAFGACGDYTIENHIPIPNSTTQKDAGPDVSDGGQKDGGSVTDAGQDLDGGAGGSDGGVSDGGQEGQDGGPVNDAGQDLDSGTGGSDSGVVPDGGQGGQDSGVLQDASVDLDSGTGGSDSGVVPDGGQGGQDSGVLQDAGADGGQIMQQCGSAHTGSYSGYINKIVPVVVGGYSFYYEGEGAVPDGGSEAAAVLAIKCGTAVIVPAEDYEVGVEKVFDIIPDNKRITVFPTQTGAGSAVVVITVEEIPGDGGIDAGPQDAGPDASDAGVYNPPACVEATTGTYSGYINKILPVPVGGYVFLYAGTTHPDGGPQTANYNIACGGSPVATDIACPLGTDTVLDVPADYRRITMHPTQAGAGSSVVSIKVEYH